LIVPQASLAGGIAIGGWIWGSTANGVGVEGALLLSSAAILLSVALGFWMRMPLSSLPWIRYRHSLGDARNGRFGGHYTGATVAA
jgi:hypothetical protein